MNYHHQFLFGKRNFTYVLIGVALMLIGYIVMIGGNSPDPNIYNEAELYGFRRTILAPILVLIGLAFQAIAIFVPSNAKKIEDQKNAPLPNLTDNTDNKRVADIKKKK